MKHPNEELLALHAGGDLPGGNLPLSPAWRVRRHVEACAACSDVVAGYVAISAELRALPVPDAPANLAQSILDGVDLDGVDRSASVAPGRDFGQRRSGIGWFVWPAFAGTAAVALGILSLWPGIKPAFSPRPTGTSASEVAKVPTPPIVAMPPGTKFSARDPEIAAAKPSAPAPATPKFMTVAAAEEDRDRRYLQSVPRQASASLASWTVDNRTLPQPVVGARAEILRSHALPGKVEVVALPGSPIQIVGAEALFAEGRLIDPSVEIRNVSGHPIANYELIWTVRDASGNEFRGKISSGKTLAPGQRTRLSETIVLEPVHKGPDTEIASARVFVRSATAADGVWVPERAALAAKHLDPCVPLNPQSAQLYDAFRRESAKASAQLK